MNPLPFRTPTFSHFKARNLAVQTGTLNAPPRGPFMVFDRNVKRLQKNRAARASGGQRSRTVDYVRDEVADTLLERFMASVE